MRHILLIGLSNDADDDDDERQTNGRVILAYITLCPFGSLPRYGIAGRIACVCVCDQIQ